MYIKKKKLPSSALPIMEIDTKSQLFLLEQFFFLKKTSRLTRSSSSVKKYFEKKDLFYVARVGDKMTYKAVMLQWRTYIMHEFFFGFLKLNL